MAWDLFIDVWMDRHSASSARGKLIEIDKEDDDDLGGGEKRMLSFE